MSETAMLADVRDRLQRLRGVAPESVDTVSEAVTVAERLLELALLDRKRAEAAAENRLARLMEDESGRLWTLAFTDQALRAERPERVAEQLRYLIEKHGVPRYFSNWERMQLRAFKTLGGAFPRWLVPKVLTRLRYEVRRVSLPSGGPALTAALEERKKLGFRVNLNHLGEAILGEDEARARHAVYLETLTRPDIDAVSIKVSSITSQIDLMAWERTLSILRERVGALYERALAHGKLVMLDMEEYRDLRLTVDLFKSLAREPRFAEARLGIVLQAYLPDSHLVQQELLEFGRERLAAGGRPIRIRIVKGANLAMERVDASLHGWPQAPYKSKAEVDANFKRMVHFAMQGDNARAVHIGIASHNLFDLAWGLVLRAMRGLENEVVFEMLEGIAAPLARVIAAVAGDLLIYAPTADDKDLLAAIAYLIRRLDENTGPDNFLRSSFGMQRGSPSFEAERMRFQLSVASMQTPFVGSRREVTQLRQNGAKAFPADSRFENEPDTDWTLPDNRRWAFAHLDAVAAERRQMDRILDASINIDSAVKNARRAFEGAQISPENRAKILRKCAELIRKSRGELIAQMVFEGKKAIAEADAEISEAIDFAEYYCRSLMLTLASVERARLEPRGLVVVTPPWNFPFAIPAGGVFAAFAAGNAVILKPAPETPGIARRLAEICHEAGMDHGIFQFLPVPNEPHGSQLIHHPEVDVVILTGGTATARRFLSERPGLLLMAETGGKNAMIVTEMADHDLAIKYALHSAFGHAGQKCSATSLLILEAPLYDSPDFKRRLLDAARSIKVGPATDPGAKVTPLIREPRGDLAWALSNLDDGESWLLEPKVDAKDPCLWSPGIKYGVKAGSRSHVSEFFGPVLSVMRADDLDHAIALANAVPYGLTTGLQSLDDREIRKWSDSIEAGCLYVNRGTTGAIVRRQPFGGMKASCFGPGAKAGGPNYVLQMMRAAPIDGVEPDYAAAYVAHFADEADPTRLLGQDNFLRYRPVALHLRLGPDATERDALWSLNAARVVREAGGSSVPLVVSAAVTEPWHANLGVAVEVLAADRVEVSKVSRVRALGKAEPELRAACHARPIHYEDAPVVAAGRVELLRHLVEQTLSVDYHRFGNLGVREREPRAAID